MTFSRRAGLNLVVNVMARDQNTFNKLFRRVTSLGALRFDEYDDRDADVESHVI